MLPISKAGPRPMSFPSTTVSELPKPPVLPAPLFRADTFEAKPLKLQQDDTAPVTGGGTAQKSKVDLAIEHMWRDNDPPLSEAEQKRVRSAFKSSLTEKEILQLDASGMRVWHGNDLPPELKAKGLKLKDENTAKAAYVRGAKVLLINPKLTASGNDIRHEMGHVRDDLGDEKSAHKPLESMSNAKAQAQYEANKSTLSRSTKPLATMAPVDGKYGELKPKKVTIQEAFEAFKTRTKDLPARHVFNSGDARNGYAKHDIDEFYAEAYAAYHGGDTTQQAKLLSFSPEMFFILEADAKARGLPTVAAESLKDVHVVD